MIQFENVKQILIQITYQLTISNIDKGVNLLWMAYNNLGNVRIPTVR